MKEDQLASFRNLLTTQLDEVRGQIQDHNSRLHTPSSTGDFAGADRAQELENQEADESIVESEGNLADKVEHALAKIENGSYGICEGCSCDIPIARLEAKPSVSLCIVCQEKHEGT